MKITVAFLKMYFKKEQEKETSLQKFNEALNHPQTTELLFEKPLTEYFSVRKRKIFDVIHYSFKVFKTEYILYKYIIYKGPTGSCNTDMKDM